MLDVVASEDVIFWDLSDLLWSFKESSCDPSVTDIV